MSVRLKIPESIFPVPGIRLATTSAGLYNNSREDLALIEFDSDATVSAVFTKNLFCAAPVKIAKQHLLEPNPTHCLINAGNANAGTGQDGLNDTINVCRKLSEILSCDLEQVLPFSTGVIGEPLPVEKIQKVLSDLYAGLNESLWLDAANAIMTTDTIPKVYSKQINIGDSVITITGVAKGAGMIKPNMATMLAFIGTDANIEQDILDKIILKAVNKSFNRITVDGDTSTNDACVLIATGKSHNPVIDSENHEDYLRIETELMDAFCSLAQSIVRDGEGATKFVQIDIVNGIDVEDCLAVAYQIAESPLVKTALTASDPNWGRVLASVGCIDPGNNSIDSVSIYLDDVCIVNKGKRDEGYTEEAGKRVMSKDEITIKVDLARGTEHETIWTTDLSYEYIKINAEYRT